MAKELKCRVIIQGISWDSLRIWITMAERKAIIKLGWVQNSDETRTKNINDLQVHANYLASNQHEFWVKLFSFHQQHMIWWQHLHMQQHTESIELNHKQNIIVLVKITIINSSELKHIDIS